MKNNYHINIKKQVAKGTYRTMVLEPRMLPGLRRVAYRRSGFNNDYDGSVASYHKLGGFEKKLHDEELSKLVRQYADQLNSPECRSKASRIDERQFNDNLILNQGRNKLLQSSGTIDWASFSTYCVVGVGTTPVVTDSGATTATTAGSSATVLASGSFFTAGMVGMLFNSDDGQQGVILSQTGVACVLATAINLAVPTLFATWAVQQTGLASESKRSNTYLTGSGNCGTTQVSTTFTNRRTYDFTAEVSNQNYTELGWSDSGSASNNLNSRTLISGGTVSVLTGQQLRVIYDISSTVGPSASTPGTWPITGWPVSPATTTDGDYILANPSSIWPSISTSGTATGQGSFPLKRGTSGGSICTGSTLPAFNSSYTRGTFANSTSTAFAAYTTDSFFIDLTMSWNIGTGNATNWRGITFDQGGSSLVYVFDEAQTKASTHTLSLTGRMTIGIILTNP